MTPPLCWARFWCYCGLALAVVLSLGCTGVGIGIGFAVDSGSDPRRMPGGAMTQASFEESFEIAPGDVVEVTLTKGEKLEGKYQGFRSAAGAEGEAYLLLGGSHGRLAAPAPGQSPPAPPAEVPVSRILTVQRGPGGAWAVGMLIGLVLDTVAIVAIASAISGLSSL